MNSNAFMHPIIPPVQPIQMEQLIENVQPINLVQQTTQTTTTTTYSNGNQISSLGGINANMNLAGFGFNVNMNATNYYPSANSTTTVQLTTTILNPQVKPLPPPVNNNPIYAIPGYNGAVGCPWTANPNDFQSMKKSIASKSFENTKLQVAKQILNNNYLTSNLVREIIGIFSFDDSRLNYAKYAYGYNYDIGNYDKVNDVFSFSSSIDELNQYIQGL